MPRMGPTRRLQPPGVAGVRGRVEPAARPAGSTRQRLGVPFCPATATSGGCGSPARSELPSPEGVQHPQVTEVRAATPSGCGPPGARQPRSDPHSAAANQPRRRPRSAFAATTPPGPEAIPDPPPPTSSDAVNPRRPPAPQRSQIHRRQRPSRRSARPVPPPPTATSPSGCQVPPRPRVSSSPGCVPRPATADRP